MARRLLLVVAIAVALSVSGGLAWFYVAERTHAASLDVTLRQLRETVAQQAQDLASFRESERLAFERTMEGTDDFYAAAERSEWFLQVFPRSARRDSVEEHLADLRRKIHAEDERVTEALAAARNAGDAKQALAILDPIAEGPVTDPRILDAVEEYRLKAEQERREQRDRAQEAQETFGLHRSPGLAEAPQYELRAMRLFLSAVSNPRSEVQQGIELRGISELVKQMSPGELQGFRRATDQTLNPKSGLVPGGIDLTTYTGMTAAMQECTRLPQQYRLRILRALLDGIRRVTGKGGEGEAQFWRQATGDALAALQIVKLADVWVGEPQANESRR